MRVLLAPDSFKGSASAAQVVDAVRAGWLEVRPGDDVTGLPLADGGEGTLDAIAHALPTAAYQQTPVDGPDGPNLGPWLLLQDGTAVVELAAVCGLPLWPAPDPLGAHTYALGQVLAVAAADSRVTRLVVAVGGSASTDGGAGALVALGAALTDAYGGPVPLGGAALSTVRNIDLTSIVRPPAGGVRVLVDVVAPLVGPEGAAAQFGPQKGASSSDVAALDVALATFAGVVGGDPIRPGAGAAGGTAFGLAAAWNARLVPGSSTVADLVGLGAALDGADVVVTGEGCLDRQSARGKVVGHVAKLAREDAVTSWAVVGRAEPDSSYDLALAGVVSLSELAGGPESALADAQRWLHQAGRVLARVVQ